AMRDSSGGSCRYSPLTPVALEVNDLVRGSQQCSAASPQLCALVEVAAGESVGVGGSQDVVTAQGVKLLLIGMEIGSQREGSGRDDSAATQEHSRVEDVAQGDQGRVVDRALCGVAHPQGTRRRPVGLRVFAREGAFNEPHVV